MFDPATQPDPLENEDDDMDAEEGESFDDYDSDIEEDDSLDGDDSGDDSDTDETRGPPRRNP